MSGVNSGQRDRPSAQRQVRASARLLSCSAEGFAVRVNLTTKLRRSAENFVSLPGLGTLGADAGLVPPAVGDAPPAATGGCWWCGTAGMAGCGCPTGRGSGGDYEAFPASGPGAVWYPGRHGMPRRIPVLRTRSTGRPPSRRRHRADSLSGPVGHRAHPHRSKQRQDARRPRLGAGRPCRWSSRKGCRSNERVEDSWRTVALARAQDGRGGGVRAGGRGADRR
jgi:hypothetical protein